MAQPLLVVLGGGAAGFFGAIRAAELAPHARVLLLEAAAQPLQKVRISGGGRCNVTNAETDPARLVTKYPRGSKELRGVLARFGPRETMQWFEARGVKLKAEGDGRIFPTTDDSDTIARALLDEAARLGIEMRTHATASRAERIDSGVRLTLKDGATLDAAALLVASGSNPKGLALAASLGHTLIPPVPSLFTFEVKDERLDDLSGVSVDHVKAKLHVGDGRPLEQEGPLLVTHWGLSAHAVLRLSAFGARELHAANYHARLVLDLTPGATDDALRQRALALRAEHPRGTLGAHALAPELPRRLWERVVTHAGGDATWPWAEVPNRAIQKLVDGVKRATFDVVGKGPFREEFVTAGGVARSEIDWRTMESRRCPGLFLAGEALDVDALTGGYNLQNAWSTGYLAGAGMAGRVG